MYRTQRPPAVSVKALRRRCDGAAMALRRRRDVAAMALRWRCDGAATSLRWRYDGAATSLRLRCDGSAMALRRRAPSPRQPALPLSATVLQRVPRTPAYSVITDTVFRRNGYIPWSRPVFPVHIPQLGLNCLSLTLRELLSGVSLPGRRDRGRQREREMLVQHWLHWGGEDGLCPQATPQDWHTYYKTS